MSERLSDADKKAMVAKFNSGNSLMNLGMDLVGRMRRKKRASLPAYNEAAQEKVQKRLNRWCRANPGLHPKDHAPGHIWRSFVAMKREAAA